MATADDDIATDEARMRRAIELARRARNTGEVPVGSVVAGPDGNIVGTGFNRRESWQDPSAHAEMIAVRRASEELETWRLEDCTVYVTLEPCPMCAGMLVNARVDRLVYGADDPKAGAVRSLYEVTSDERLNHTLTVDQSPLADECGELLSDFFRAVREGRAAPKPDGE